jgi:hypothetical protein
MAKTIQEAVDYLVSQTLAMNKEISTWSFPLADIDKMLGDPKTTAMERNMLMILKTNANGTTKH